MSAVAMQLQDGPNPTSIRVRIKNLSTGIVSISAPNPYSSVCVFDCDRLPFPRVRAVAWEHSQKTSQIEPNNELLVTIDLLHYWDEICGDVFVQVRLQVAEDSGFPQEYVVEGSVFLNIPSYREKYAEMKRFPKTIGSAMKLFDVSDSTKFEQGTQR